MGSCRDLKKTPNTRRHTNVIVALLCGIAAALFSGCSSRISTTARSGASSAIVGSALPFLGLVQNNHQQNEAERLFASVFWSQAIAAGCTATASLYELNPGTGDKLGSSLGTATLRSDASFELTGAAATALANKSSNVNYLIEVSGCNLLHSRPVTSLSSQAVSAASTLLNYVTNVNGGYKLTDVTMLEVESLLAHIPVSSASSIESVYNWINVTPTVKTEFETLFGITLSTLRDAKPDIVALVTPTTINEQSISNYQASVSHWDPLYTSAYIWKLDGVSVSTSANYAYTPSANAQGMHTLELFIGKDAGGGALDLAKPYHSKSWAVVVDNSAPPVAPSFALSVPATYSTTRNLTLTLNTGAALANCATFTGLAVTENTVTAPTNAGDYTITCSAGPTQNVAYTLLSAGEGTKTLRLWARDGAGNISAVPASLSVILDTSVPTLTAAQMSINGGAATSSSNIVQVSLQASDSLTKITHFCLKYNDTTTPALAASCWTAVNAPAPGLTPATTLNLVSFDYLVGFVAGAYNVYAWVKDEASNISTLTNAAVGTAGTDKATIAYAPGTPPVVANVISVSSDTPSDPMVGADLTIAAGASVFIKWTVTDDQALPATPITLYYTTNDVDYTLITSNISNSANAGCTIAGVYTGCYRWTNSSPASTYYKIRVAAQDSNGMITLGSSVGPNAWPPINILAGNTDPGLGGSAVSAVFFNQTASADDSDPGTLVVTPSGVIYFRDVNRGILKVDPATGIQSLYLRTTGTITGNGGNVSTATLAFPAKIALDYQNRLLIFDQTQIRRVDLSTNIITRFIGGGASTADGVVPTDVSIVSPGAAYGDYQTVGSLPLIPLPNGDLYFQSSNYSSTIVGGNRIRVYSQATGLVNSISPSGTGVFGDASRDVTLGTINHFGLSFDPLTSAVTGMQMATRYSTVTPNVNLNPATGVSMAPHPPGPGTGGGYLAPRFTGRDGNMYAVSRFSSRLFRYNLATNTWTTLLGTGTKGSCTDGTAATSCRILISDAFVTAQSQIYFMDRGRLRTIDSAGNVVTIVGQSLSYGDGGNALNARLNVVNNIDQATDTSPVIVLDLGEARFREFTIGGNITTIAGNGTGAAPALGVAATGEGIVTTGAGPFWDDFKADGSGNVYYNRGQGIAKLNRATGFWEMLVGNGATSYAAADGLLGANISFPGYPPRILGFNGTQILAATNRHDGTNHADIYMKLYAITNGTQSAFAGTGVDGSFAVDGTAGTASNVPNSYSSNYTRATYDSFASRWAFARYNSNTIKSLTPGGNIGTIATLGANARSFVYRHDGANNIVYYCGNADGKLHKYNVTTTTDTTYTWPIASMRCTGRTLIWNATRESIIFPFTQNGLAGIAEYTTP